MKKSTQGAIQVAVGPVAKGRTTLWGAASAILIAGLDTPADEKDGLCDARNDLPLNEELVDAIIANKGTKRADGSSLFPPVEIVLRDGTAFVVDGRQRLKAVRAASEVLGIPLDVEFVQYQGDTSPKALFLATGTANAGRVDDTPLAQARACDRARRVFGATLTEFATSIGLSEGDMRARMALLKLQPELIAKVESGELPFSVGEQIGKMPPEEQIPAYNHLVETNQLTATAARRLKSEIKAKSEGSSSAPSEGASDTPEKTTPSEGASEKAEPPKVKVGLELSQIRKLWNTTKAETCPLSDTSLTVIGVLLGEIALEDAPADLRVAIQQLRDGTLPTPKKAEKKAEPKTEATEPKTEAPKKRGRPKKVEPSTETAPQA